MSAITNLTADFTEYKMNFGIEMNSMYLLICGVLVVFSTFLFTPPLSSLNNKETKSNTHTHNNSASRICDD